MLARDRCGAGVRAGTVRLAGSRVLNHIGTKTTSWIFARRLTALGASVVLLYALCLPLLRTLLPGALPAVVVVPIGAGVGLFMLARYPGGMMGLYASGFLSFPFLFVSQDLNPLTGWSLVPLAAVVLHSLARRRAIRFPLGGLVISQLALSILMMLGVTYGTNGSPEAFAKAWRFVYLNVLLFIGPMFFVHETRRLWNVLRGYMLGVVLWSIAVYLSGEIVGGRLGFELIGGPIGYGRTTGIASTLMICAILTRPTSWGSLVFAPLAAWLLHGTILSGTRGALVAFVSAVLVALVLTQRRVRSTRQLVVCTLVVAAVAAVVALYIINSPPDILTRYAQLGEGISGESASVRLHLYSIAVDMFAAAPIIGMGTSAYPSNLLYPHNIFLEAAAELGMLGLMAVMLLVVLTARCAFRVLSAAYHSEFEKRLVVFMFSGFVFFLVEAQFSGDITTNKLVWFFSGLIWTVYASTRGVLGPTPEIDNVQTGSASAQPRYLVDSDR